MRGTWMGNDINKCLVFYIRRKFSWTQPFWRSVTQCFASSLSRSADDITKLENLQSPFGLLILIIFDLGGTEELDFPVIADLARVFCPH